MSSPRLDLKVCPACFTNLAEGPSPAYWQLRLTGKGLKEPAMQLWSVGMVLRDCKSCEKLGKLCLATSLRVRTGE